MEEARRVPNTLTQMKASSTTVSASQRARVASRMRNLMGSEKLRLCLGLCNKYLNVPDSEVPPHLTTVFPFMKSLVTRTLVPRYQVLRKEFATQPHVVILVHRDPPMDAPSRDGLWFAFARSDTDGLVSNFQFYLSVHAASLSMRLTRDTVRMPRGSNASIAPADAQLLIDFARSTHNDVSVA